MTLRLPREAVAQLVADLLGTPPPVQQLLDHCAQHDIGSQLGRSWSRTAAQGASVRGEWPVGAGDGIGVAAKFPADGGRVAADLAGDRPHRRAQAMQVGDADAFILGTEPRRGWGRRGGEGAGVALTALVAETTPVSPLLTGRTVNPDQPTRLGIVQPLFHQAKVVLALGR